MAEITESKTIIVKLEMPYAHYGLTNDGEMVATLNWVDGVFDNFVLRDRYGNSLTLNKSGIKALRELMQEVVTTTNNPPVGCEPV